MTNQDHLINHIIVVHEIVCSKCCNVTKNHHSDEYQFSEELHKEGWHVTSDDNVLCPNCVPRNMRKK